VGSFLVPVSKRRVDTAEFDTEGQAILQALYRTEENDLTDLLAKLKVFIFEEDEEFLFFPVEKAIEIISEVDAELRKTLDRTSTNSPADELLHDLRLEIEVVRNWLGRIGTDNSFYLIVA